MANKGYYEYDPVVYPRKLWVMIGGAPDDINRVFSNMDGTEIEIEGAKDACATTYPELWSKENGKFGELVSFRSKKDMTMGFICHEAWHVLDAFISCLPLERVDGGHNEHLSYLLQWICDRINMARLGKGEFVEIKENNIKQIGYEDIHRH